MNRIICLLLICTLAALQGLSLHAHLPHSDNVHVEHADHVAIHIHSHLAADDADNVDEHSDAKPIDLLMSTAARDYGSLHLDFAIVTLWALILTALWCCIQRLPPPIPLVHFGPPQLRRHSPRAPPR